LVTARHQSDGKVLAGGRGGTPRDFGTADDATEKLQSLDFISELRPWPSAGTLGISNHVV
jgi:hypothetical protein